MSLVLQDRVQETASAPGTGAVSLLGAVIGFQPFSSGVGNGNTCYYCIADRGGANWEVGLGTYSSAGNILTRTTPYSGSSATPVDFSSGEQVVFVTYPAEKSVNLDASGNVSPLGTVSSGTWQGTTVDVQYGGTGVTTISGLVYGNATSPFSAIASGNAGQLLSSNGASAPDWQDPAYGTLGIDLTNLNGGTASAPTGPLYINCGGAT